MAQAKADDLLIVNRGGKDYQATVRQTMLPIKEYPDLAGVSNPWDHLPVLFHVIVEGSGGECLVSERDRESDEYTFEIYNLDTGEKLDLMGMLGATTVKKDQSFFVPTQAKRKKKKQEVRKARKEDREREASGFDGNSSYYDDGWLPSIQLPMGQWIIGFKPLPYEETIPDGNIYYYEPNNRTGCDFYGSPGDFELGPLTDTAKLADFDSLFDSCEAWNNMGKPLPAGFKTDSAGSMQDMFCWCTVFNQPVNHLKVDKVFSFELTFYECAAFNQDVSQWDTSNAENFLGMFNGCGEFNGDVSGFDMSKAKNLATMFTGCKKFTGDVSKWKWPVGNVLNMDYLFMECEEFDCDLSGWDTTSCQSMRYVFQDCKKFNSDISGWDTTAAVTMNGMFRNAASFNQDLSGWCVSNIKTEPQKFKDNATAWTKPQPVWGTCP